MSGSIYVHVTAGALVDAPAAYGPYNTLYNRSRRWSEKGVFQLLFSELARSAHTEAEEVLLPPPSQPSARPAASNRGRRTSIDWPHLAGD